MLVQCFNDRDEGTAEDDDRHNFYGEIESWSYNFSPLLMTTKRRRRSKFNVHAGVVRLVTTQLLMSRYFALCKFKLNELRHFLTSFGHQKITSSLRQLIEVAWKNAANGIIVEL